MWRHLGVEAWQQLNTPSPDRCQPTTQKWPSSWTTSCRAVSAIWRRRSSAAALPLASLCTRNERHHRVHCE
eukprot:1246322-Prymnesium_polylepis.1